MPDDTESLRAALYQAWLEVAVQYGQTAALWERLGDSVARLETALRTDGATTSRIAHLAEDMIRARTEMSLALAGFRRGKDDFDQRAYALEDHLGVDREAALRE